jgi:hypothetical protein
VRHPNRWYEAICEHLRAEGAPLTVDQIWQRMEAARFRHSSVAPRGTLGARIAELVQQKKLARVGPATYQLLEGSS